MRYEKIGKGLDNLVGSGKDLASNIGKRIKEAFDNIVNHILFIVRNPISLAVAIVLLVLSIILYIVGYVMLNNYFKTNELTCLGEFDINSNDNLKEVPAVPESYSLKNNYSYETTTQKADYKDFNIKSNHDYKKINITGAWIPWFGDEITDHKGRKDKTTLNLDTPNRKFICNMYRKTVDSTDFGNTQAEKEFYYIKNYYSNVGYTESTVKNNRIDDGYFTYKILNPNEQQQCWLNRGMGLYMGFFGKNGKTQPPHLHHLVANKAVCETPYFIPESHMVGVSTLVNKNYIIAKGKGGNYTVQNFLNEFFSVSYYMERDKEYCQLLCKDNLRIGGSNTQKPVEEEKCKPEGFCGRILGNTSVYKAKIASAKEEEKNILSIDLIETTYNIRLHEDLLYKYGVRDPGMVIAESTNMFNQACYSDKVFVTEGENGSNANSKTVRNFLGKFRFEENDENRLLKKYAANNGGRDVEYNFGEIVKFIILDRYYEDNQGSYKLEFLSGFNIKQSKGSMEEFLTKIEKFMLGTSMPDSEYDRKDGLMFKIYSNIVNGFTRNLARAILSLYIIINGFMFIFGYKKPKIKEFAMFCFKVGLLFAFLSENAWALFNKTFINLFVNGTIGIINLIYDIFSRVFITFDITNNNIFNYNAIRTTNELYLSSHFKFLDNIFQFLFSKEVHLKIFAILFTFPIIGIIPVVFIYYLLIKYVLILLGTAIPYLKTLLQLTILIGLAPLFLLFMFFETTNEYFKNWLNYLVSRMFELIVFFFVLFFACGLVNNKFLDLLGYEICKENVSELLKNAMGL